MLFLLHEYPRYDYPGDYLMARLQYRRVRMVADRDTGSGKNAAPETSDAAIWDWSADERRWLFRQMHLDLRLATAAVFLYFEIRGMVHALRFIGAGQHGDIGPIVNRSLLFAGLKKILLAKMPVEKTVDRLAVILHDTPLQIRGLPEILQEKGIQGCEETIRTSFFKGSLGVDLHPDTHSFFTTFITMQNALTMAKCRRWDMESTPQIPHYDGFGFKISSLPVTEQHLQRMVRRLTGGRNLKGDDLHPLSLEPVLHKALLEKLARERMGGSRVSACIEYLMICHSVTMKRSSLLHKRQQDRKSSNIMETVQ